MAKKRSAEAHDDPDLEEIKSLRKRADEAHDAKKRELEVYWSAHRDGHQAGIVEGKRLETERRTSATVTVTMTRDEADRWRHGLADVLCWARGFVAACPDSYDRHPLGVGEAREVSLRIERAIELSEKEPF